VLGWLILSCAGSDGVLGPPPPTSGTIKISQDSITLLPRATVQLAATATDESGRPVAADFTWTSSDSTVVTVSRSGVVTAVAPGTALISAAHAGKAGTSKPTIGTAVIRVAMALVVGTSYTESFTGTAGPLSGTWSQQRTSGTINKNGAGRGVGSVNAKDIFAFWSGNTFSNDQYSQARIAGGLSSGSQFVQIIVRATLTGDGRYNNYLFYTDGLAGASHTEVAKNINGSQITFKSFPVSFAAGDIIKISAVGTTITCYKNGVAIGSITDSSLPSGAPGIGVYGSTVTVDDWEGGTLVAAAPPAVAAVSVSPSSASIVTGTTQQLTATTTDSSNNVLTGRTVTWASDNSAVATVDANGLVTAVAAGTATITATSEGKSGTATITVTPLPAPVATVTVAPPSANVVVGSTEQLTATTTDSAGNVLSGRSVSWSSDAPAIATVNARNGLVSAVSAGVATITATSEGKNGTSTITVSPVPVASLSVSPPSASVVVGNTQQLNAVTKDSTGTVLTGRAVTWSSDNAAATVDANGLVTAVGVGTATITATSEGKSGTSVITVTSVPVASVTVAPATASVMAGATQQLTATTKDANGNVLTGRAISWSSSNVAVATVNASTGLVTGVAPGGPVTITATSEGKGGTASITVTPVPVASVTVTPSPATVAVGGTQAMSATLRDANNNVLTGRSVTWSSNAPSVASVNSSNGVVTGVSAGSATVTATSEGKSGAASVSVTPSTGGSGPLRVSSRNRRYFETAAGQIVYLTGSHTWSNLQDNGTTDPPPVFNYTAYLDFLVAHGHNFFRLWTWEQAKWTAEISSAYWFSDGPYQRLGPGTALDGKPKFDLSQFNQNYFDRVRSRVQDAGSRGIYVSIMLFDGWSVTTKPGSIDNNPWKGHPFNSANNVNGINGDANGDGLGLEVQTLADPSITAIQDAYVRKVIDAVNDLDNVLFEIDNEGDATSKAWQYHMIQLIRNYEATKPKQHPIGITAMWPGGSDSDLYSSAADWVSPTGNPDNPVTATGSKVVIADTDHLCGICGNVAWVWRSITRGQNPILMDGYDGAAIGVGASDYNASNPVWEAIRKNLGYARSYSNRINMAAAVPRGDLASTGYALAVVGTEYLVFQPSGGSVSVNLAGVSGVRTVEWFNPSNGQAVIGASVNGGGWVTISAPFSGASVAYIHP